MCNKTKTQPGVQMNWFLLDLNNSLMQTKASSSDPCTNVLWMQNMNIGRVAVNEK